MLKKFLLLGMVVVPAYILAQRVVVGSLSGDAKLKDAQPAIGQVLYDFSYISDTAHPERIQKEIVALDISNDYSRFYSQTFAISDSLMKADIAKQFADQAQSGNITLNAKRTEGSADIFLTDKKTNTVAEQKNFMGKNYLISDGKPTIDWDIQDSTKIIGNYTCQKAIGTSKGRQYIVWFTTDLPHSFGPRRLNGLPGLILEAHDITNRIVYTFKQYTTSSGSELGVPEDAISATTKEFADMQAAFKSNPMGFRMSASPSSASPLENADISKIKSISINKAPSAGVAKKVINFPIDLTKD
ncbi:MULTISPECIES: GLPGLI family protein [Chitinophagaceae]